MKKMIQATLLILMGLAFGANAFAQSKNLSVPLKVQEHSQWCWAGSTQMVFYFKAKTYSQCAIANYAEGINYACGNSTFDWQDYTANAPQSTDTVSSILQAGGLSSSVTGRLSQATSNSYINGSRPYIILWEWTGGGGHFVVVKGYSGSTLYINDPWPGHGSYTRSYSSTVSSSDRSWYNSAIIY